MVSFRCYDNSDVIATLIITNFHLYLIQLLWQFFQIFVYDDAVYAQTWEVFTLKLTVLRHLKLHVLQLALNILALIIKLGQPFLVWSLLFNNFQSKHLKTETCIIQRYHRNEKTPGDFLKLFKTLTTSVLSSRVEATFTRQRTNVRPIENFYVQVQVFRSYGTTLTVRNFRHPGGYLG